MIRSHISPLLVAAALLLLLAPAAQPFGYRRFTGLAKQRFGGLGRHRLSGLGRRAKTVADKLMAASEQGDGEDDLKPSFGDFASRSDRARKQKMELKRLFRHRHHHHKKVMAKTKRLNGKNEICLFKALRRCGNHLITKLSSSDANFDRRCSSKEEFLDCMSQMQHGHCHVKHGRHGPSRELVQQYQQRLRRLLQATRGCIIGVDLSTDAD